MNLEQTIRDLLYNLADGNNSPDTWNNKQQLIEGIYLHRNLDDLKFLHTIQLELSYIPSQYKVLVDKKYDYNIEDLRSKKIEFITEQEFELEQQDEEAEKLRWEENKHLYVLPFPKSLHKQNLRNDIVGIKHLSNYVLLKKDVLYGSTYKLELYTSHDYTSLPIEDLRLKYIDSTIQQRIDGIESEIRKYPEQQRRNPYLTIIKLFRDRLLYKSQEITDKKLSFCYKSIYDRLNDLLENTKAYFTDDQPEVQKKLEYNESIQHFTEFFDNLINRKMIDFQGRADRTAIYSKLLHHINFPHAEKAVTIFDIRGIDKSEAIENSWKYKAGKINFRWYGIKPFCREFQYLILPDKPKDSIISCGSTVPIYTIADQLFNIFIIQKYKYPHTPIGKPVFNGKFPEYLREIQSESHTE